MVRGSTPPTAGLEGAQSELLKAVCANAQHPAFEELMANVCSVLDDDVHVQKQARPPIAYTCSPRRPCIRMILRIKIPPLKGQQTAVGGWAGQLAAMRNMDAAPVHPEAVCTASLLPCAVTPASVCLQAFLNRTQQCFAVKSGADGLLDVARATFCSLTEEIHALVATYRESICPDIKACPTLFLSSISFLEVLSWESSAA